ncbi:MAG: phosphoglycerate dehydrogenase [Phycisphaerales bacterium]
MTPHVIGLRSKTQLTPEVLAGAKRLLAIGAFCAGTNQIALDTATLAGTPVFNAPFSNTRSVAEMTIAEVIALHRGMFEKSHKMHQGVWDKSAKGSHEVRGRTLGIVGYGHIGSQVSVLAEAMGLRVLYYDIMPKLPLGNARAVDSLDQLLAWSDVVTLHVPATPLTKGMIGPEQIARMKPGGYLINNARGNVVDVEALARAIADNRIAGAALDVFPDEPAAKGETFESVLRGAPNVILTPHVGGSTIEAQAAISEEVAGKLLRFINNGSTMGAVNVPQVDLPGQQAHQPGGGELRRHRVLNFHRNEPGFLNRLNGVLAEAGANVSGQYLQTQGNIGYVVLDVDPSDGDTLLGKIDTLPGSIRSRILW